MLLPIFIFSAIASYTVKIERGADMKRIVCVLFLCLFLLSSCRQNGATPLEMAKSILLQYPEIPFGQTVYCEGSLPGQIGYMSPRLRSLLYDGGRDRELPEFTAVCAYAVLLSDGLYGAELHVFQMNTEADADQMKTILLRRAELLKRRSLYIFAPGAYEDYFVSSQVVVKECFVFFLCTGRNEEILKKLENMI